MGSPTSIEVPEKHIVFFDGHCNLCNRSVDFIIKHDPTIHFIFESLQSDNAKILLGGNLPESVDYILVLTSDKSVLTKSKAAFFIAKNLQGWPQKLSFLSFIPTFITDFFYDIIAKYRYIIFGKQSSCRIPTEEDKLRFLEGYQNG